jgi:hypothetical protein
LRRFGRRSALLLDRSMLSLNSLFEFDDEDLVSSVLYILYLMLRVVSPHYVASFVSNLFLFVVLGPYDVTIVKVDDQPIVPGDGWMSFTPCVVYP